MNEDWFAEAAEQAANSEIAKRAREAAAEYEKRMQLQEASAKRLAEEERERARRNAKSPVEVQGARAEFEAVAAGRRAPHEPVPWGAAPPRPGAPRPGRPGSGGTLTNGQEGFRNSSEKVAARVDAITPELGLEAILRHVRKQPDPYQAVGEWITRTTAALSAIAAEVIDEG